MIKVKRFSINDDCAKELAQRFNEVNAKYMGYVPRSQEFWIRSYGSGHDAGLLVAIENKDRVGYAIVIIRQFAGFHVAVVSELCVWRKKQEASRALLNEAERYAKERAADAVMLEGSERELSERMLQEEGFLFFGEAVVSVGILSFQFFKSAIEFMNKMLSLSSRRKGNGHKLCLEVNLSQKYPTYHGVFAIEMSQNGSITVSKKVASTKHARISSDVKTFTEIIFGLCSPYRALISGRLRVVPFWRVLTVIKLLKTVSGFLKWYTCPFADYHALDGS